jgi:hypothetical protein
VTVRGVAHPPPLISTADHSFVRDQQLLYNVIVIAAGPCI